MDRRRLLSLSAFLLYVAVSIGYWGWRLLPHPGRDYIGETQDPLIFIWSFAWWPHALLHGMNPFVTHELFAPEGINLTWTTSTPTLALAFAPLTLAAGPVVAFNAAALLLPALAGWTMFLLCRYLTGSFWASLVGGYLFGFSSFILGHEQQGHINLTGVFLLPLVALVLIRFLRRELTGRQLALRLGPLVALQLGISTEILLTLTLALVLALLVALLLVADARGRLRGAFAPVAAGYAFAALLAAPLTIYAILGFQRKSFTGAENTATDAMALIVPTHVNALAGDAFPTVMGHFDDVETTLYLGPPTLLIVVLFAWRSWPSRWSRVLVATFLLSVFFTLGPVLRVNGRREAWLPTWGTRWIPGLDNIHFPRLGVYVAFSAAVIVALWTARAKGWWFRRPYVLPVLAVAAIVLAVWKDMSRTPHPDRVAFFSDGLYRSCVPPGETLAVFPYGWFGNSMLWQAEAGFRFRLAEGYLSPRVFGAPALTSFQSDPVDFALNWITDGEPTMDALLAFAARHDVGRVVATVSAGYPSREQLRRFGPVEEIGGVYVAPACGRPPLATGRLTALEQKEADVASKTILYCDGANGVELRADLYPSGYLQGVRRAIYVDGTGLTCDPPPAGYVRRGFAPRRLSVPPATYVYYAKERA